MAKKQTRRSVSLCAATYEALRADCAGRGVSMSDHLEQLIAADRAERRLPRTRDLTPHVARVVERVLARHAPAEPASAAPAGVMTPEAKGKPGARLREIINADARAGVAARAAAARPRVSAAIPFGSNDPEHSGRAARVSTPAERARVAGNVRMF